MRVVLLGKGEMLANLILGVEEAKSEIVGVFRGENLNKGRVRLWFHDNFSNAPEVQLIKAKNLFDIHLKSANSDEFKTLLLKLNPDIIIVGTWGEKLKKEIFSLPKFGTVNVHPSILPKYRGPNPYLQVIWHREQFSGATFHFMDENFDSGAILMQEIFPVQEGGTGLELRRKVCRRVREGISVLLPHIENGTVIPRKQNENEATYFPEVSQESMTLDFSKETAVEILAHVRAFHPFRPTYIQDGNFFWIVNPYNVSVLDEIVPPSKIITRDIFRRTLKISAKDGKILIFKKLKPYTWFSKFRR